MTLSDAIIYGNIDEVSRRLKHTSQVNFLDEYGYTPLIQTAIVNDIKKAELLLKASADVNLKDITGRSVLHWAVDNSNFELAKMLLKHGADPNSFNRVGEPVLVKPLLRHQQKLIRLLIRYGAQTAFAYDYIHAKLIGHRFELVGSADIVNPDDIFVEIDYEGFYLDLCLNVIQASLKEFRHNYAARFLTHWFAPIEKILRAFSIARDLIQYDHYLMDVNQHKNTIERLLTQNPLMLPINQSGHAITLLKYENLIAICDRSPEAHSEPYLTIHEMLNPHHFSTDFLMDLLYEKQEMKKIHQKIHQRLKLTPRIEVPLSRQVIGNCSWTNVEGVLPLFYIMFQITKSETHASNDEIIQDALELYQRWKQWDKTRTIHLIIDAFHRADRLSRKATLASLLAGVLFQRIVPESSDEDLAEKIIGILKIPQFEYILKSYLQHYRMGKPTQAGKRLVSLLEQYKEKQMLSTAPSEFAT